MESGETMIGAAELEVLMILLEIPACQFCPVVKEIGDTPVKAVEISPGGNVKVIQAQPGDTVVVAIQK
jgi:hypothetical protein